MAAEEVEIPIKLSGLGALKAELRDLKGQLANATDPAEMERLAKKAGELTDRIKDANEAVKNFATGSKFEGLNNQLRSIGNSILSLDFKEANEKAAVFAKSMKSLGGVGAFKELASGVTNLIGTLGKLGTAILTNPILLIVAIVAAVVIAIITLKDKIKILGDYFDLLMTPINLVIQGLKNLTDWLGLTSFASDELATKTVANNEKMRASNKDYYDNAVADKQREINLYKAQGKDVTNLEIEKNNLILKGATERENKLRQEIQLTQEQIDRAGNDDKKKLEDNLKEKKKSLNDETNLRLDTENQLKVIAATAETEKKKKDKEVADARKAANAKQIQEEKEKQAKLLAQQKEYTQTRLEVERLLIDLTLGNLKDGVDKEIQLNDEKYRRLIEDVVKNEKYSAEEKQKIIQQYGIAQDAAETEIRKKQKEKEDTAAKEKIEKDVENKNNELQRNIEHLQTLGDSYENRRAILKAQEEQELADTKLTEDQKTLIHQKYAKDRMEIDKEEAENKKKIEEAKYEMAYSTLEAIGNIASLFAGKNEQQARKAFQIQKGVSIAQALIKTYEGATGALASGAANPITAVFPAYPYIQAAAIVAAGLANVKQIASQQFNGGSSGGGGGTTPSAPNTPSGGNTQQQLTPSFNLFGKPNELNNVSSPTPTNGGNNTGEIIVKAVVSETDVTSTQNRVKKIQNSAEI